MRIWIIVLAVISVSCGSLINSSPQINRADFAITEWHTNDSTCVIEQGELFIHFRVFNTETEVKFKSESFNIHIPKAIRTEPNSYSYSGIATDGTRWDVTIGVPRRGDAIIAFRGEHGWTIIDYKCFQ